MKEGRPADSTILVIEDDADIRETVKEVLEDQGYRIVTAANGREGLDRLDELASPSLILLDLMMPVMNGAEFLAALRDTGVLERVPVVVLSAWSGEMGPDVVSRTRGVVKKPVALDELLDIVGKYAGASRAA